MMPGGIHDSQLLQHFVASLLNIASVTESNSTCSWTNGIPSLIRARAAAQAFHVGLSDWWSWNGHDGTVSQVS